MNKHFSISEFVVLDGSEADTLITPTIADKILEYHLSPLNSIRDDLGMPVHIRSGFRPVWWELAQGRDGTSQHCYIDKGATDLSLEKHSEANNKPVNTWLHLFELLIDSPYKRIAYYPELRFFHCDYNSQERQYFNGDWIQQTEEDIIRLIRGQ